MSSAVFLERRPPVACFFDPRRPCGSRSRTKLAYKRAMLVTQAKRCGFPYADELSLDVLCELLRAAHGEQQKTRHFVARFLETDNELPVPLEVPHLDGTLTAANAHALLQDRRALSKLHANVREALRSKDPDRNKRARIAAYIFFHRPSGALSTDEKALLDAFGTRVQMQGSRLL